ncbi:MAG: VWA domain-containing protein [Thermoplasmata archaeon]|nr:MAG: VWA domain-containing protein [Thermoplasmata archaeon]
MVMILAGTLSLLPLLVQETLPNASGSIPMNVFFDDMESGGPAAQGKWYVIPYRGSRWELGTPVAPPNPYSPTKCWGTEIDGNYMIPSETLLRTPYIDLVSNPIISAKLSFWHIYNFSAGDGGWVEVYRAGGKSDYIEPEGGYPGLAGALVWPHKPGFKPAYAETISAWEEATFDLSDYIGEYIYLEFYFVTGSGVGGGDSGSRGWYIDDVSVDIERYDGPLIDPDQTGVGLAGETLSYTLTIRNYNVVADYIDIYYTDENNWQVRILDAATYLPLQDNGGIPGLPDVYLEPYAGSWTAKDIVVNVTIPVGITDWDISDLTTIYAKSFENPLNQDTAELITKTPFPDVGVNGISLPIIRSVGEVIIINVSIKNYGDWRVSFDVKGLLSSKLIIPPSLNPTSTQSVSNLGPDEIMYLEWSFIPTVACEYKITVTTLFDIDQFIYNNKSTRSIFIQQQGWSDDMEANGDAASGLWEDFIDSNSSSTTSWEVGIPKYGPSSASVPSPTNVWGTDLDAPYQKDTDCYLFTPDLRAFNFMGCDSITLAFSHWWRLQSTPPVIDVTSSETSVEGTVIYGSHWFTRESDDSYEAIQEEYTGGKWTLEHIWTIPLTSGGASWIFNLESAIDKSNSGSDDFDFYYSTDGTSWTYMVTVTATTDTWYSYTFGNLSSYSLVYIMAKDSNEGDTNSNSNRRDTLYIDAMHINSTAINGDNVGEIVYSLDPAISQIYFTGIEYTSNSSGWEREEIDMTSFVADKPYVRFGWRLFEDIGGDRFEPNKWAGWYLDDVAVWASPSMPELMITEIIDDDSLGNQFIEVYNADGLTADTSDYNITLDRGITWLSSGTWSMSWIPPGEYAYYEIMDGGSLDGQGETVYLVNTSIPEMLISDEWAYGQMGTVPDPIPGESVARYWDGSQYKDEWARDPTPTIGFQNDGEGEVDFKYVVLNEVLYNPGTQDAFVELRYVGYPGNDPDIDIDGWILVVGDSVFTIPPPAPYDIISTVLNLDNPFYVINESMFSGLFGTVDVNGDNIYLYTDSGLFGDEVGWSDPHTPDTSMSRVPDGYGVKLGFKRHGLMGYDDPSSIAAGWQFERIASMSVVAIEQDQIGLGDVGWVVVYDLIIVNHQEIADYIDIFYSPPGEGWIFELYEGDNVTQLADNDGDGILDTDLLQPNEMIIIKVKVTIPLKNPGDFDEVIITARSSKNQNGWDTAVIRTKTYPHIEVSKSSNQDEIWLNGTGMFPQATTITLEVRGSGLARTVTYPQDVIFCIDSSGSMEWNDPDGLRKDAAKSYVDDMSIPEMGAALLFSDNIYLPHHLSTNYNQIKDDIDRSGSYGGTHIGSTLHVANTELIDNGNESHTWIIILLTDGRGSDNSFARDEAERAAENGIRIYTIGLGYDINELFLQEIANITGGKYYPAATPEALEGIYHEIGCEVDKIAGRDVVLGDNVYFVRDVLPPWIDLVPGTFNVYPDNITVNASGYTILEWEIDRILVGETLLFSFDVVSNEAGLKNTNYVDDSRVRFVKWNLEEVTELFPEVSVNVKLGPPKPPQLFVRVVGNDIQLYWGTPDYTIGLAHYLIYKAPTQTTFDFSDVWVDTSKDDDNGTIPLRTTWNVTDAALDAYPEQEYYIIRAVNQLDAKSVTSNTVGKWTKTFYKGVNTFSLPLEPFDVKTTEWYTNNIANCDYIKWMNSTTHTWVKHDVGDGLGIEDGDVVVGEGYEISVAADSGFTFCGRPGAHIRYIEGELPAPARFALYVVNSFGDVRLSWDPVAGADHYIVYKSGTREGLNHLSLPFLAETADTHYIDYNAAFFGGTQYYYMVVAVRDPSIHTGFNGSYSRGVWTEEYGAEYDTFGLPLKSDSTHSGDRYCDAIPEVLGMNYYNYAEQRWMWHKTIMPQRAYDPDVVMCEGYQISTTGETRYSFVGI